MDERDRYIAKANLLLASGSRQLEWGYAEVAIKSFRKALEIFQECNDSEGEIKAFDKLGESYLYSHKYTQAIEYYQKALNLNDSQQSHVISKIWVKLGRTYQALGEFPQAIGYYQKGLAVAQSNNDQPAIVKILSYLGGIHYTLGEYDEAVEFYQEGLRLAQEIKALDWEQNSLDGLAEICAKQGEYYQAIDYHQECLSIARASNNHTAQLRFLGCIGNHYSELEDYEQSINCYQERLITANKVRSTRFEVLANLKQEPSSKILTHYQYEFARTQQANDVESEIRSLKKLAIIYQTFGKYEELNNCYKRCLDIAELTGDQAKQASILSDLFSIHAYFKNYAQAIDHQYRSLKLLWALSNSILKRLLVGIGLVIFRVLKLVANLDSDTMRVGKIGYFLMVSGGLGDVYLATRNYTKAVSYYEAILRRSQQLQDLEMVAVALAKLGEAYRLMNEFNQAIDYYEQSLAVFQNVDNIGLKANILTALGDVYFKLAAYDRATSYFKQSISIAKEFKDCSTELKSLMCLGNVAIALDQYSTAIDHFEQALAIAETQQLKNEQIGLLINLHNACLLARNYEQSIAYGKAALARANQIKDSFLLAGIWGNLGNKLLYQGDLEEAHHYLQTCFEISRSKKDNLHEILSLSGLGLIALHNNKLPEAESLASSAVKIVESVRRQISIRDIYDDAYKREIFEQQITPYYLLQRVLIRQGKFLDALMVAEQSRARVFADLLAWRLSNKNQSDQFQVAQIKFDKIKMLAQERKLTLVEYSILPANSPDTSTGKIVEEWELLIWVVTPLGQPHFRQVSLEPLQAQNSSLSGLVKAARNCLDGIQLIDKADMLPLENLYQLLIAPIADFLPLSPENPVIFVPHKTLFLVPFAALRDAEKQQFLLEKHTTAIIPSLQVLSLTRSHQQEVALDTSLSISALVVGNPKMPTIPLTEPPVQLQDLAWAKTEVNAIASLLNTQAITGAGTTKAYITQLLPKAKLIHLATHGLLDDIRQLGIPGAIALAPDDEDNGFLTAGEIYNMKLNAELVVLSACDTGQGKITGDGVIGLSRCLIAAGVKSVIVSLWSVDDLSTTLLMVKFYQIFQQGVATAIALNEAQRWLMSIGKSELTAWMKTNEKFFDATLKLSLSRRLHQLDGDTKPFKDPRYWAAFCVMGQ